MFFPFLIIENGEAHDKIRASFFEGRGSGFKGRPGSNDIIQEEDPIGNRAGTAYAAGKVAEPLLPVEFLLAPGRESFEAGVYIKIPCSFAAGY
jgi:hypothetical protein